MTELLEYIIALGGSLVLFLVSKYTNMGVRHFTQYLCMLIIWSIVLYFLLYLLHKVKGEKKENEQG